MQKLSFLWQVEIKLKYLKNFVKELSNKNLSPSVWEELLVQNVPLKWNKSWQMCNVCGKNYIPLMDT